METAMTDPFSAFFDPDGSRGAQFADMVAKAADGGFKFERSNGIPVAKVCESKRELAAWFRAFARSCKAA
jgi:hypothetical protein